MTGRVSSESKAQEPGSGNLSDNENQVLEDAPAPEEQLLPKDVVFGLLSAKRRRYVLKYLAHNSAQATLSDLAEYIAAKENDTEVRMLTSQQRKRVYVALYQAHLPKMDSADVVDFNDGRGTVELRPKASQLYQYLEVSPGESDRAGTQREQSISSRVAAARSKMKQMLPDSA